VLDNVTLYTLNFLQQNLPHQNNQGNILFTTRTESLASSLPSSAGQKHQVLELCSLQVEAAAEHLYQASSAAQKFCPLKRANYIIARK
jgi:hypothetical protein